MSISRCFLNASWNQPVHRRQRRRLYIVLFDSSIPLHSAAADHFGVSTRHCTNSADIGRQAPVSTLARQYRLLQRDREQYVRSIGDLYLIIFVSFCIFVISNCLLKRLATDESLEPVIDRTLVGAMLLATLGLRNDLVRRNRC